ncbi:MAG: hypothetical protein MI749_07075 [Desulfovibrionales bacterium]|nr:hypothetical protein [Desulfovibrionales bacterium]
MKKIFALMLLAGLLSLGISSYTTVSINPILKKTVHYFGPKIMGSSVQLEDAKLSTLSGYGTLRNLYIANPPSFPRGNCLQIGRVDLDIDPSTIGTGVVTINTLTIRGLDVAYREQKNVSNVAAIVKTLRQKLPEKRTYPPNPSEEIDYKKIIGNRYIIKDIVVTTPSVSGFLPKPQRANYSVIMDDMHFSNIGTHEHGIPFLVALEQILSQIESHVEYEVMKTHVLYKDE